MLLALNILVQSFPSYERALATGTEKEKEILVQRRNKSTKKEKEKGNENSRLELITKKMNFVGLILKIRYFAARGESWVGMVGGGLGR